MILLIFKTHSNVLHLEKYNNTQHSQKLYFAFLPNGYLSAMLGNYKSNLLG